MTSRAALATLMVSWWRQIAIPMAATVSVEPVKVTVKGLCVGRWAWDVTAGGSTSLPRRVVTLAGVSVNDIIASYDRSIGIYGRKIT